MMALKKNRKNPDDTVHVTPRSVDPEHRDKIGGNADKSSSDDQGPTIRREPEVVEADGGDIGGVAGGGIDSNVSGLGGDKNRR